MPVHRLHLDSRYRDPLTSIAEPTFSLSKTISNVTHIRVKNVQFANTMYNVTLHDIITVSVDNGSSFQEYQLTEPGFYTPEKFVQQLNTSFDKLNLTVVLTNENKLQWFVPSTHIIDGSRTSDILGLDHTRLNSTQISESTLLLTPPMSISFICRSFQNAFNVFPIHSGLTSHVEPFLTVGLKNGYGQMEYTLVDETTEIFSKNISTLHFKVVDSGRYHVVPLMRHWTMTLELY